MEMMKTMKMKKVSGRDEDVQDDGNVSSFLTLHQLMKNEQRRYVSMDVTIVMSQITQILRTQ